jgi:hypothetical protein
MQETVLLGELFVISEFDLDHRLLGASQLRPEHCHCALPIETLPYAVAEIAGVDHANAVIVSVVLAVTPLLALKLARRAAFGKPPECHINSARR